MRTKQKGNDGNSKKGKKDENREIKDLQERRGIKIIGTIREMWSPGSWFLGPLGHTSWVMFSRILRQFLDPRRGSISLLIFLLRCINQIVKCSRKKEDLWMHLCLRVPACLSAHILVFCGVLPTLATWQNNFFNEIQKFLLSIFNEHVYRFYLAVLRYFIYIIIMFFVSSLPPESYLFNRVVALFLATVAQLSVTQQEFYVIVFILKNREYKGKKK